MLLSKRAKAQVEINGLVEGLVYINNLNGSTSLICPRTSSDWYLYERTIRLKWVNTGMALRATNGTKYSRMDCV